MKDIKEYIESGILELYVAGKLSEQENQEVHEMMYEHPEIKKEVEEIEKAILLLTASVAPGTVSFNNILNHLNSNDKRVIPLKTRYNWVTYTGWAASILLAAGLVYNYQSKVDLQGELELTERENRILEIKFEDSQEALVQTQNTLDAIRSKDVITIPLGGQGNFADSYAKVYWNKEDNSIYIDGSGLPETPTGKVWQIWSLTLNPLTPTSLGTIDSFNDDEDKLFKFENEYSSEAFGITLEPTGGSESPTMDQLHTLGVVNSNP
ncbi:anti-sigma factor [Nonlabens tegetincola]|uniref:anti-sigma factor n=1 Tax=Nonlabens tegetincola TaxID=323273 RepID=UPI000CF544EB|nr:anti-sigma factor [Nonlabens tegetincola]PQJ14169.1 anti-sigma factor [Nonlabens tegetincola]